MGGCRCFSCRPTLAPPLKASPHLWRNRDLHGKYPEIRTLESPACRGREVRNHASLGLNLLGPWCPVSFLLTLQTRVREAPPHPFHLPLYTAQLPQMDLIPRLLYIPALSPESQTLGFILACILQRGTRWAQTCSSWFRGEKQAEEGRTSTGGCEGCPLPKWQSGLFLTHITLEEGKNSLCVCVSVCTHVLYMPINARGQLQVLFTLVLKTGSLPGLELAEQAKLAAL